MNAEAEEIDALFGAPLESLRLLASRRKDRSGLSAWRLGPLIFPAYGGVLEEDTSLSRVRVERVEQYAGTYFDIPPEGAVCHVCKRGWDKSKVYEILPTRTDRPVRVGGVSNWGSKWAHEDCETYRAADEFVEGVRTAFADTGGALRIQRSPNTYWPQGTPRPLLLPNLRVNWGQIDWEVRPRKRVYDLHWNKDVSGLKLFAADNVTCGERNAHAWHFDQLADFIRRVREA